MEEKIFCEGKYIIKFHPPTDKEKFFWAIEIRKCDADNEVTFVFIKIGNYLLKKWNLLPHLLVRGTHRKKSGDLSKTDFHGTRYGFQNPKAINQKGQGTQNLVTLPFGIGTTKNSET